MIPGLLLARISLLFVYGRRYIAKKRRKPDPPLLGQGLRHPALRPLQKITVVFEEAVREKHEMPEEHSRGTAEELEEPALAQLDEIYLYAHFLNVLPTALVEEFDCLKPSALTIVKRKEGTHTTMVRDR